MNDSDLDAIFQKMAAEHRPQLPSSGLIWLRAQLLRKTQQKERIERPLVVMRGLASLIGAVVLFVFVAANWRQMPDDTMSHPIWFLLLFLLLSIATSLACAAILLWSPAKR